MQNTERLHNYFENALAAATKTYLKSSFGNLTFGEIFNLAVQYQKILVKEGIKKGDRVVIYSSKNSSSIAMMIACSLCNCVYVPVSSVNPAVRAKFIIDETSARFILCDQACNTELNKAGLSVQLIQSSEGIYLYSNSDGADNSFISGEAALILFTSGSTGTPKGVVISHLAAITFIEWAATEFSISKDDIIASISPFNFDLSIFDIYVAARQCAILLLYSEEETKNSLLMAQKISVDKATTIYATPTFYSALVHYGKLDKYNYDSLKNVLFAGEVFHFENFNKLLSYWPGKNYANLYGPTETNVCSFFKVDTQNMNYEVFPIGKSCVYAILRIADDSGNEITGIGVKGEMMVAGNSLFNEYWNDPEKTLDSIYIDNDKLRYYKTGDIVFRNSNSDFVYVSRKDRMIKKNGFRIEPLEIEKVMLSYPDVSSVAVCFVKLSNQLICFLERAGSENESLIVLKQFCQKFLPSYMIPDKFIFLEVMPKTSSGKIDLQSLEKQVNEF